METSSPHHKRLSDWQLRSTEHVLAVDELILLRSVKLANMFGHASGCESTHDGTSAPRLFFLSPIQLWLGPLISKVTKSETLDDDWLPEFAQSATLLRDVFAPLKGEHASFMSFLMQFETGGMLLLGALLEVCHFAFIKLSWCSSRDNHSSQVVRRLSAHHWSCTASCKSLTVRFWLQLLLPLRFSLLYAAAQRMKSAVFTLPGWSACCAALSLIRASTCLLLRA